MAIMRILGIVLAVWGIGYIIHLHGLLTGYKRGYKDAAEGKLPPTDRYGDLSL